VRAFSARQRGLVRSTRLLSSGDKKERREGEALEGKHTSSSQKTSERSCTVQDDAVIHSTTVKKQVRDAAQGDRWRFFDLDTNSYRVIDEKNNARSAHPLAHTNHAPTVFREDTATDAQDASYAVSVRRLELLLPSVPAGLDNASLRAFLSKFGRVEAVKDRGRRGRAVLFEDEADVFRAWSGLSGKYFGVGNKADCVVRSYERSDSNLKEVDTDSLEQALDPNCIDVIAEGEVDDQLIYDTLQQLFPSSKVARNCDGRKLTLICKGEEEAVEIQRVLSNADFGDFVLHAYRRKMTNDDKERTCGLIFNVTRGTAIEDVLKVFMYDRGFVLAQFLRLRTMPTLKRAQIMYRTSAEAAQARLAHQFTSLGEHNIDIRYDHFQREVAVVDARPTFLDKRASGSSSSADSPLDLNPMFDALEKFASSEEANDTIFSPVRAAVDHSARLEDALAAFKRNVLPQRAQSHPTDNGVGASGVK